MINKAVLIANVARDKVFVEGIVNADKKGDVYYWLLEEKYYYYRHWAWRLGYRPLSKEAEAQIMENVRIVREEEGDV